MEPTEEDKKKPFRRASRITRFVSYIPSLSPEYVVWCQGMLFFEGGGMTVEKLNEVVAEKFLPISRLRAVYDGKKGGFYQLEPEDLDMSYHIQEVSEETNLEDVTKHYMGDVYGSKEIDLKKPLWYVIFFPNLTDGRSLALCTFSHTIGDGVSLIELIYTLMDPEEKEQEEEKNRPNNKKRKVKSPYGPINKTLITLGGVFGALMSGTASPDSKSPLMRPDVTTPSKKKSLAFTAQISLDDVKEIKNIIEGATINDVLVALLNQIVVKYLSEKGLTEKQMKKKKIRASFLINARNKKKPILKEDGSPGNNFAIGMFRFFTSFKNSEDLIHKVKRRIDRIKLSPYPYVQLRLGNVLATIMSRKSYSKLLLKFASQTTAQLSNVPGPQKAVKIGGETVIDMQFGLYSVQGLYLGLLSYDNKVSCCVCMDDKVGEASELAALWEPEFIKMIEEIRNLEGVSKRPRGTFDFLNRI